MIEFLKPFLSSKVGWAAVLLHLIAVVYSFWGLVSMSAECGPFSKGAGWVYIAGTGLHWTYESVLMKILLILDLPALGLAEFIGNLFGMESWCFIPRTWTLAILGLFFASLQWYGIGLLIQTIFVGSKTTTRVE